MNEQVKAEIVKIVINIGDKTVEITGEQALKLRDELNKLFPKQNETFVPYVPQPSPYVPPPTPTIPWNPSFPWSTPWNPDEHKIYCISIT